MTKVVWIFLLRLRLATRWVAKAQNDRTLVISTCFCHTEPLAKYPKTFYIVILSDSEVSINSLHCHTER